jgi:hypothetical protein
VAGVCGDGFDQDCTGFDQSCTDIDDDGDTYGERRRL